MTLQGCGVLTLAAGPPLYARLAANLARSFRWWHRQSPLRFSIAIDHPEYLPADVLQWAEIVPLDTARCGIGFRAKLHLDEMAQADRTLFVDADCLCVGNLEGVFQRFQGRTVGVVGGSIAEGEWFGDVAQLCRRFKVAALPKFNGGVYYLERGPASEQVYAFARELESRYDEIGMVRLRNQPNDELLLAVAMAAHGLSAVPDDGSILGDPLSYPRELSLNVLRGRSRMVNPAPGNQDHQPWYHVGEAHPLLVHFLGHYIETPLYKREEMALALAVKRGWPAPLATCLAFFLCYAPQRAVELFKKGLRPCYHRLFHPRAVKASPRSESISP